MTVDWHYLTIIAIWVCAAIGYACQDGIDPWVSALIATMILAIMR